MLDAPTEAVSTKTFDDAAQYRSTIRSLVPGYTLLHELIPAWLSSLQPRPSRVAVIGSGPGDEVCAIARALPDARIVAVDPELDMVRACRRAVNDADLFHRVDVMMGEADLLLANSFDVVVSTLVGHLINDDGSRRRFYRAIRRALSSGGQVVLADIDAGRSEDIDAYVTWAGRRGMSPARQMVLRRRLTSEFACLSTERRQALQEAAGFAEGAELFRAFNVCCRTLVASTP